MSNSRPMQLIDYACGHSTPARGTGRRVNRVCPDCEPPLQRYTPKWAARIEALAEGSSPGLAHDPYFCAECAVLDFTNG